MKSKGVFLAAIFATVLCASGHVLAALSGSGTEASPYLIQSRADFDEFANPANAATYWAGGIYTKLMCDPNLAGTTYTQAVIAPDTSTSSDFQGTKFYGIFDGNDHTISNLTITASTKDFIGLFGYVGSSGQIRNLNIKNANITGHIEVGGLVGGNGGGMLTSCYATGVVSGNQSVGGLVGLNEGMLTGCNSTCSVSGSNWALGGLVGQNANLIIGCYATGSVNGGDYGDSVGGLVGSSGFGAITSCYATGSVSGLGSVGGLVGGMGSSPGSTLTSCYATGPVFGNYYIGGLVGVNLYSSTITNCYSNGLITVTYNVIPYSHDIGGLVGSSEHGELICEWVCDEFGCHEECHFESEEAPWLVVNSSWDTQTSAQSLSSGGTGKTTAEMMTLSTFTSPPANWDFSDTDGDAADWMILRENEDYPRLAWQEIFAGDIAGLYGVDMADLMEVVNNWLQQGCPAGCDQADIDNSGTVDLTDLAILAANWMMGG